MIYIYMSTVCMCMYVYFVLHVFGGFAWSGGLISSTRHSPRKGSLPSLLEESRLQPQMSAGPVGFCFLSDSSQGFPLSRDKATPKRVPSHQQTWKCTKAISKRKFVFLQGSVHQAC